MANYESVFLSNYFLIKDRNEFNKFIDSLICNDEIDIYESDDDPLYIAFGAYSCIPITDYEKDNSITFETELPGTRCKAPRFSHGEFQKNISLQDMLRL